MSLAILYSRASVGIEAPLVTVEVHLAGGLPKINMVGLPATVVKESKERVKSAIETCRFEFPFHRVTINLAPADLPKVGGRFDLPIALGVLVASKQLPDAALDDYEFAGELALSGALKPIRGCLPLALSAKKAGRNIIVPIENAEEASLATGAKIYAAKHLLEVCEHLRGGKQIPLYKSCSERKLPQYNDIRDVKGQPIARRVLEIAASGGHSLLFVGPPGSGKTLLANRLLSILPPLSEAEAAESAAVLSISHLGFDATTWKQRPFRSPHHSASGVALVGGGNPPHPGEITLAHNGILFLDELPEFGGKVLETLREPLESGQIMISRSAWQTTFPANFQFMSAMNPCPCGYFGDKQDLCRCTPAQILRYQKKLSGPLLDRIDMHLVVSRMPVSELLQESDKEECSDVVRKRVEHARTIQLGRQGKLNCQLKEKDLQQQCVLDKATKSVIEAALNKLNISARAYHRLLRVARTLADMEGESQLSKKHLFEAINYRRAFYQPKTEYA